MVGKPEKGEEKKGKIKKKERIENSETERTTIHRRRKRNAGPSVAVAVHPDICGIIGFERDRLRAGKSSPYGPSRI